AADRIALLLHRDVERALVPFRMRHGDHRRLDDTGAAERLVFHIDRGDPFAARFDDVLGAVGDLHIAIRIERADITRGEPAVLIQNIAALALEITARDPRAPHLDIAKGDAVARQLLAVIAGDFELDTEDHPPLLDADIGLFLVRQPFVLFQEIARGAERA